MKVVISAQQRSSPPASKHRENRNKKEKQIRFDKVYLDAINGAIFESRDVADDGFHFGGGHVLAAPPERVSGAVFKEQIAALVHLENVARQEGGVAAFEHVEGHLLLGGRFVSVAVKVADRVILLDHADEHARLARLAADAHAVLAADRLACIVRHLDQRHRIDGRSDHRNEADGADASVKVDCPRQRDTNDTMKCEKMRPICQSANLLMLALPSVAP